MEVLKKTPVVGRRLLSMNLHLFPVKEWKLGGKASVMFLKGTIEEPVRAALGYRVYLQKPSGLGRELRA